MIRHGHQTTIISRFYMGNKIKCSNYKGLISRNLKKQPSNTSKNPWSTKKNPLGVSKGCGNTLPEIRLYNGTLPYRVNHRDYHVSGDMAKGCLPFLRFLSGLWDKQGTNKENKKVALLLIQNPRNIGDIRRPVWKTGNTHNTLTKPEEQTPPELCLLSFITTKKWSNPTD